MLGVTIEFDSDVLGEQICIFEAEDVNELYDTICKVQDIDCLCRQCRAYEGKKSKEADKLELFVLKRHSNHLTLNDFKGFNVNLNVGRIICLDVAENDEQLEEMKRSYKNADCR